MKKRYRFLIACIASLVSLLFSVIIYIDLFDQEVASGFGAATAVGVFFFVYRSITPAQNDLLAENTKLIEEFHANGITKERGKLIYGKKEGEWEYYNEEGVLIKELIYNDDHLMRTIDYTE